MSPSEISKRRRSGGALAAAALIGGAVVYAVYRLAGSGFDWERFRAGFRHIEAMPFAAGLMLILLTYVGRALRWRVLISHQRPRASLGSLLNSTFIGFTAVSLFGRPGELVRPYLIARKLNLSVASQLAAWLLERIYDLLAVLVIFGLALTQVQPRAGIGPALEWILHTGGYLVAGLGFICVAVLISTTFFSEGASRRINAGLEVLPEAARARVQGLVSSFAGGMGSSRKFEFVSQIVLLTVLEWLVIVAANYYLFRSLPGTAALGLTDTLVFLGFVSFGSIVQLPGIGGGMQVAGVLVLTQLFGLNLEGATAATLMLWFSMYFSVVPVGLLAAVREGLSWKALRNLQAEASVAEARTTEIETR
ncbi:MAG TPA: lysylphosphatidylglycerol synthase transmembrane domain-containing protein [Bryobacteraceae bacterium]|nr:lysylphosphatidylglycerol synthase transmembrane domain-containing protein [Bryobacteraceae bacterium]